MTKSIFASKTLWLAILTGITGVLQAIPQDMISSQHAGYLTTALAILTFANRFITTEKLSF